MDSKFPKLCTEASPIASASSIGDRLLTVHLCRLVQTPEADLVVMGGPTVGYEIWCYVLEYIVEIGRIKRRKAFEDR
jgi:hypothetical protein